MVFAIWSKTILFLIFGIQTVYLQDFSYLGSYGPDHWGEQFTACSGKQQSPINIDLVKAKNYSFPPLEIKGFNEVPKSAVLQNNGHTVIVTMDFQEHPTINGGPLNDTYQLAQFHFHWGDDDGRGSEDLINNQSFPVELHMVFFNRKYKEFSNAVKHIDGVVVLAYFFKISNETNLAYVGLSLLLERIVKPNQPVKYSYIPKLQYLVSHNFINYFTYTGSLTTPPCSEVVTWIDFETPIPITSEQIKNFRNLRTHENQLLTHNYRPIQPLNGRVVYRNVPQKQEEETNQIPSIARSYESNENNESGENSENKIMPVKKKHKKNSSNKIKLEYIILFMELTLLNYVHTL